MADTPKQLLDALDLVTTAKPPSAKALGGGARGTTEALHVKRVRDIFEDRNIVAVGISEKQTEGKATGVLSLCFYVEKKLARRKLAMSKLVPPVISSRAGQAVFTDVKEIGRVEPQIRKKIKPIQSGFSVGHVDITAGTLGAIVQKNKKYFILSNSHVLAEAGRSKVHDKVVYPGPADGGALPKHLAGTLARFIKFKTGGNFINRVDAALCAIDKDRLDDLDFTIYGLKGKPKTIAALRGMTVVKRGRTTDETEGVVQDVNFRVVIDYGPGVGQVGFLDQILCTRYSKPGDSGSIVVDKKSGKIVGLHFAGASGGSVFNPIADVIAALGFTFAAA